MTASIIKLPTRSRSYFTVRHAGRGWAVQLVTPTPGAPIRTTLARCTDRDDAIEYGRERAAAMMRPFKIGRAGE